MLTVADMAEGGVKNGQKSADILYGRPLCQCNFDPFLWGQYRFRMILIENEAEREEFIPMGPSIKYVSTFLTISMIL